MTDRRLLVAAASFAAATTYGAVVTGREPLAGEPFGIRVPGSARRHVAFGLGSALSAPWPMPALALVAALAARPGITWTRTACLTVGWTLVGGTLAEPATWGRRQRSKWAVATVPLNLLSGVGLVVAARHPASRESNDRTRSAQTPAG